MIAELTTGYQGVKALVQIINAHKELSASVEVRAAVIDIQQKLLESHEKQTALAARVQELQTQLREVEDWKTEMQRYQLVEFPDTKTLALKLRADMAKGEPIHYLCRACSEKKKKTTLQPDGRHLACPECKTSVATQKAPLPRRTLSSGVNWKTL